MTPLKTIIVDDEWLIRSELKYMLNQYSKINVVGEAASLAEAIQLIQETIPDVVFLDIQMPGGSGFDLLEQVDVRFKIVFITAFDHYMKEARKLKAEAYLMKPISMERLSKVINIL